MQSNAKITVDDDVRNIKRGELVFVPLAAKHRLENPVKSPMLLIDSQLSSYLGEDGIVRYEDTYLRHEVTKYKCKYNYNL